jgi:hypothetical protein
MEEEPLRYGWMITSKIPDGQSMHREYRMNKVFKMIPLKCRRAVVKRDYSRG